MDILWWWRLLRSAPFKYSALLITWRLLLQMDLSMVWALESRMNRMVKKLNRKSYSEKSPGLKVLQLLTSKKFTLKSLLESFGPRTAASSTMDSTSNTNGDLPNRVLATLKIPMDLSRWTKNGSETARTRLLTSSVDSITMSSWQRVVKWSALAPASIDFSILL